MRSGGQSTQQKERYAAIGVGPSLSEKGACDAAPANQVRLSPPKFQYWHFIDCRATYQHPPVVLAGCTEDYNLKHFDGGNIVHVDGHVKWRRERSMRSSDYGLRLDEPWRPDTSQNNTLYDPAF